MFSLILENCLVFQNTNNEVWFLWKNWELQDVDIYCWSWYYHHHYNPTANHNQVGTMPKARKTAHSGKWKLIGKKKSSFKLKRYEGDSWSSEFRVPLKLCNFSDLEGAGARLQSFLTQRLADEYSSCRSSMVLPSRTGDGQPETLSSSNDEGDRKFLYLEELGDTSDLPDSDQSLNRRMPRWLHMKPLSHLYEIVGEKRSFYRYLLLKSGMMKQNCMTWKGEIETSLLAPSGVRGWEAAD